MGGVESQDLSGKNVTFTKQNLVTFPAEILSKERPWISHLNLSYNMLSDIPRLSPVLPSLRTLQLNYNNLTSFPTSLNMNHTITRMDISHNSLEEFAHVIIPNLEDLRMNHTKMTINPHILKLVFPKLKQLEMAYGESSMQQYRSCQPDSPASTAQNIKSCCKSNKNI
ncbi:hypothetical protein BLNAU_14012 [Blattamonas nauphoetae]|uniref:Uncharacterized protein n=1 Tax=Blattamonas nauphoetae TaxID=2049346 RepID=A0ABQ9XF05_9EUKA|nr:hypothetical protein BLNAU_14012 [Blattamonas nauphoetae]